MTEREAKKGKKYEPPAIIAERHIEALAVLCDPNATPGLPVKNFAGEPTAYGFCQDGFLNS